MTSHSIMAAKITHSGHPYAPYFAFLIFTLLRAKMQEH